MRKVGPLELHVFNLGNSLGCESAPTFNSLNFSVTNWCTRRLSRTMLYGQSTAGKKVLVLVGVHLLQLLEDPTKPMHIDGTALASTTPKQHALSVQCSHDCFPLN